RLDQDGVRRLGVVLPHVLAGDADRLVDVLVRHPVVVAPRLRLGGGVVAVVGGRVVWAQPAPRGGDGLVQQRQRLVQPAQRLVGLGQVPGGGERQRVGEPQLGGEEEARPLHVGGGDHIRSREEV